MTASTGKAAQPAPPAGVLEHAAWLAGASLICVYMGAQLWLWRDRASALEAFEAQRFSAPHKASSQPASSHQASSLHEASSHEASLRAERASFENGPHQAFVGGEAELAPVLPPGLEPPDTQRWSPGRIAAFSAIGARSAPTAVLRIDAVELTAPIYQGATEGNLNRGAAWIEGTAQIGQRGNIGLAAHRDGYFRALKDVQIGDAIEIDTGGERLRYRIVDLRIVSPQAVEVLAPTDNDALTLVTCYPFYFVGSAPQRFIVRAERI